MSEDRTAIVLGGAGDVGEGIVRQMRRAGWTVIVPSRSAGKLDALASATEGPGGFVPLVGEIGSAPGAAAVRAQLPDSRRIDLVVASIGGWWGGSPLLQMQPEEWDRVLANSLSSHFFAARAFAPLVLGNTGGQYVFVNGGAALVPVPQSGVISIVAAAQAMMQRVIAAEHADGTGNAYSLLLNSLILTRSRTAAPEGSLTADEVGRKIIANFEDRPENGETVILSSSADV